MILVADGLLNKELEDELEVFVRKCDIGWTIQSAAVVCTDKRLKNWVNQGEYNNPAFFASIFFRDGALRNDYSHVVQLIVANLNEATKRNYTDLYRAQTNCTVIDNNPHPIKPHVDMMDPHDVLIYYINDSDGDTIIYDDEGNIIETVTPKKGRILLFDGKHLHSSYTPKQTQLDFIFNMNLRKPE